MPTTTTITTYSNDEKADEAFRNHYLLTNNVERWKAEAKANGNIEEQAKLMGLEYTPEYWYRRYLMYTSFDLNERAGKLIFQAGADEIHPDVKYRIDLLEAVIFIIENGAAKHVKAANEALEELHTEVDYYELEETSLEAA